MEKVWVTPVSAWKCGETLPLSFHLSQGIWDLTRTDDSAHALKWFANVILSGYNHTPGRVAGWVVWEQDYWLGSLETRLLVGQSGNETTGWAVWFSQNHVPYLALLIDTSLEYMQNKLGYRKWSQVPEAGSIRYQPCTRRKWSQYYLVPCLVWNTLPKDTTSKTLPHVQGWYLIIEVFVWFLGTRDHTENGNTPGMVQGMATLVVLSNAWLHWLHPVCL